MRGFLRMRCDTCRAKKLVAFSCERRGSCPGCGAPSRERVVARLHAQTTTANDEKRTEQQRQTTRGRSRIDFRRRQAATAAAGSSGNSVEAAAGVAGFHEVASTKADAAMVVDMTAQFAAAGAIIGDRIANHRHGAGLCHCPAAEYPCRAVKGDAAVCKNISFK